MLKSVRETEKRETESNESQFWELIGLRVQGMNDVLLGAVEFQRQSPKSAARRALSHYLSSPPANLDLKSNGYPPHLLKVAVRAPHRKLKDFVLALNRGEEPQIVLVDLEMVQLCFDFRRVNPSLDRQRFQNEQTARMCFRSVEGHVVTAALHSPLRKLRRSESFLGLTDVVQRTELRDLPMPDLIVHRRFFSMVAACDEERHPSEVFDTATASPQPLIGVAAWRYFQGRRDAAEGSDDIGSPRLAAAS